MNYENNPNVTPRSERTRSRPKEMSGIVGRLMSRLGLGRDYNGWMVVSKWPEIAGAEIARRATATRYADGCLYVAVADAAWRQELSMKTESLLEKIRGYPFGKSVTQIRFVQGKKGT